MPSPKTITFTFVCATLFIHTAHAQDFVSIARSARAEAEMAVRRRNVVSLGISRRAGPSVYRLDPPVAPLGGALGVFRNRRGMSTAEKFSRVHGARTVSPAYHEAAMVFQTASNLYLQRMGTSATRATISPAAVAGFRAAFADICFPPIVCDQFSPFRRADGRCNNLFFPYQGSESTPQPRLLPAAYENFFEDPRLHGVGGIPLPSPRHVSNMVHQGSGMEIHEFDITLYLMQWGQFTDHDIVLTPISQDNGDNLVCAKGGIITSTHPECLQIRIHEPVPDPFFPPSYIWMDFVRSLPAINTGCIPGQRQQMNKITSYIDASNVYGSTDAEQATLRIPKGRLRVGPYGGENLPECPIPFPTPKGPPQDYCLHAGDIRVMEQPSLSMIHTVFMREHNRIAAILDRSDWDDERLFQETRKIVAAEMQHITYNEYLPLLLGPDYTAFFQLKSAPSGFRPVYSPYIDASIVNVFAAASYRYGHSQVPNHLGKTSIISTPPGDVVNLEDHFFNPNWILKPPGTGFGVDWLARYVASENSQATDSRIEQSVRNKLFQDGIDSLDLASLNIQRGRDHGLPPYNAFRMRCGRLPYLTWTDAQADHTLETVTRLRSAYNDPWDIDMFTGVMSEKPLPGGYLGPTNACIIGNQFYRLKRGDRFFYENPFPLTGFTLDQLNSIKTTTLARIICQNTGFPWIQARIFHKVSAGNPLVDCTSLPDINFTLWSGFPFPSAGGFYGSAMTPPSSPLSAVKFGKPPQFLVPNIPIGKAFGKPLSHKIPVVAKQI